MIIADRIVAIVVLRLIAVSYPIKLAAAIAAASLPAVHASTGHHLSLERKAIA